MTEGIELPNQGEISTLGEKETYKYLEYWKRKLLNKRRWKKKSIKKTIPQENEKTTRNQTM